MWGKVGDRCSIVVHMQTPDRNWPRPWAIIEEGESFRVVDANGFPVCYIYYEEESSRAFNMKRPNRKQAAALASRIAKIGGEVV